MEPSWTLNLEDIKSSFSSAHFVLGSSTCEPLHGHDYNVKVAVRGELNKNQMVVDFLKLKPILRSITRKLDGKFLLPTKNSHLEVFEKDDHVLLRTLNPIKEYLIPVEDVASLPIKNSTVEELAAYIHSELVPHVRELNAHLEISVWVGETQFQGAWFPHWEKAF